MGAMLVLVFGTVPAVGFSQMDADEVCDLLAEFESLSAVDYQVFESYAKEDLDRFFESLNSSEGVDSILPSGWLRNQTAMQMAQCYLTGRGTEKDVSKAIAILESPARAGHANSAHVLASIKVFNTDDAELQREGFLALQKEADAGSAYAAGKVGWAHAIGSGTEKDEARALELYFLAANAGMTYWQYLLAHAYEQGYYGLPIDPEQASYWREFEPKIHITIYECEIAGNYARGLYPSNTELQQYYLQGCEAKR
ncbi:MAG: hypothetical protein AAF351_00460 [Pseudomonadota bacterium]